MPFRVDLGLGRLPASLDQVRDEVGTRLDPYEPRLSTRVDDLWVSLDVHADDVWLAVLLSMAALSSTGYVPVAIHARQLDGAS